MDHRLVGRGLVSANQLQNAQDLATLIGSNTGSELVFLGAMGASGYAEYLSATTGLDRISNKQLAASLILSDVSDISTIVRSSYCPIFDRTRKWSYAFCIPQYPRRNGAAAARHELSSIITRQEFGDACRKILRRELTEHACGGFLKKFPEFSAARRFSISQFAVMLAVLTAVIAATLETQGSAALWPGFALSLFFGSVICLRVACLFPLAHCKPGSTTIPLTENELPVYTIMVPLYKEANIVHRLIKALMAIDYPASLLDIKLILEEDDPETIDAVLEIELPGCFETIIVPASEPRTKPKALDLALTFARGEFLVIYDAEDRPDPDQLRPSVAEFRHGPERLACLQCSLAYYNSSRNWHTRPFAIEYACLFDVILPKLSSLRLPIPLGGTSNHFRTGILQAIGGWDPHNVTEEADLGIRLKRLGFEVATLTSSTHEEAAFKLGAWLRQRSRWLKGWIQTWLVHNRNPGKLYSELGFSGFLVVQVFLFGVLVSAVCYPIFMCLLIYRFLAGELIPIASNAFSDAVLAFQAWVFLSGFFVCVWHGWIAIRKRNLRGFELDLFFVPVYWLLISAASWHAIYQFVRAPFYWEKTAHGED